MPQRECTLPADAMGRVLDRIAGLGKKRALIALGHSLKGKWVVTEYRSLNP